MGKWMVVGYGMSQEDVSGAYAIEIVGLGKSYGGLSVIHISEPTGPY